MFYNHSQGNTVAKALATSDKTSKFADIDTIMRDPQLKTKLLAFIDEVVACKAEIYSQQQNIKALRDSALDELRINPKLFSALAAAAYNNDYALRKTSLEEQVNMLEHVMGEIGFQPAGE